MNFEEFKKEVVDNIKDYLPAKYEDAEIEIRDVMKNNDTVLDAITIRNMDSNASLNIYLENFFNDYKNGKNLETVIGDIADVYIENAVDIDFKNTDVMDFESVKDKIMPRLVNAEMNQNLLEGRPYVLMDDLAITFAIEIEHDENGIMSAAVSNELMEIYHISTEEFHNTAMLNMNSNMEVTVVGISETVKEAMIFCGCKR